MLDIASYTLKAMPAYRTPEYEHLLEAEKAIADGLRPKQNEKGETFWPDPKDVASLASALVRVIDQKRIMRGHGAPKPVEARNGGQRYNGSRARRIVAPMLLDVTPVDGAPTGESAPPVAGDSGAATGPAAQPPDPGI